MLNIKKNLRKSFFFLENLHFETWHDNYNESDNDILKCKEKIRILKKLTNWMMTAVLMINGCAMLYIVNGRKVIRQR